MKFKIYKHGQGKYTRLCTGFGTALIVAIGCLRLHQILKPALEDWGYDKEMSLWISVMGPFVLFAIFAALIYWIVNKPKITDFMIASESEMKKVSWSSRKEITVSTFVVIVVVVFMAVLLGVTDLLFTLLFSKILS